MQYQPPSMVGYTAPYVTTQRKVDFTVPIAISISVTVCFCPILGIAAMVIAIVGKTQEQNSNSSRIRRASLYISLAGFLCGILLIGIILIVSFANRGSEIYVKPPGEEYKKFWISEA